MSKQRLIDLPAGHVFSDIEFSISMTDVEKYRAAIEDDSPIYRTATSMVPPSAVAALSLGAMLRAFELTPGVLHASQDLEFSAAVEAGTTLVCRPQIKSKSLRGGHTFVSLDFSTWNADVEVLEGRTTLILPSGESESE